MPALRTVISAPPAPRLTALQSEDSKNLSGQTGKRRELNAESCSGNATINSEFPWLLNRALEMEPRTREKPGETTNTAQMSTRLFHTVISVGKEVKRGSVTRVGYVRWKSLGRDLQGGAI